MDPSQLDIISEYNGIMWKKPNALKSPNAKIAKLRQGDLPTC